MLMVNFLFIFTFDLEKFSTIHKLDFYSRPYDSPINDSHAWQQFQIGTCEGLWGCSDTAYVILALDNTERNNGHLIDVFQWFEHACRRDNMDLKILEILNQGFKRHLIKKRGFKPYRENDLIKEFRK